MRRQAQSPTFSQPSELSPDRVNRSRSRGRANFIGAHAEQLPRQSNRSSSRASFLGRPRQRIYQICSEQQPSSHSQQRWRSESRTVRGSLDDDDGYVFTDEDDDGQGAQNTAAPKNTKARMLSTTAEEEATARSQGTTPTQGSAPLAAAPIESERKMSSPTSITKQGSSAKEKDVEAQHKHPPKPVSRLSRIPYPIAHFLGYRSKAMEGHSIIPVVEKLPRKIETYIWAWIGAMLGLAFVMITFSRWDKFSMSTNRPETVWTAPIIVGSFGASSVILYGTPASPLGQPKAFVGGQFLSALTSVCITKLFALNSHYNPNLIDSPSSLVWVAGGIATGTALCVMILTDTVHPPGGATALLAATSPPVVRLGWRYLPVVLLSSVIMEAWAMLWMNLGRARYPHYWLAPSGSKGDQRDFRLKFPGFGSVKTNNRSHAKSQSTNKSQ